MATIPHSAAPLDVLLSALPSLPRPLLARLATRLIDRLDEMDGDADLEEGNDLELTDGREVEDYDGGHANPPLQQSRTYVTA